MEEERMQYLLIGDDDARKQYVRIVEDRLKFLREHTDPNALVDWAEIEHAIRVDTAKRLGLILKW